MKIKFVDGVRDIAVGEMVWEMTIDQAINTIKNMQYIGTETGVYEINKEGIIYHIPNNYIEVLVWNN